MAADLFSLQGRVALVTGGSRGIGRASCVALGRRGATVIVNYVSREDAARETWVAAYDSNAGAIRALYPKRRPQQDLFFDDFRARNAGEDDGGGDDPAPEPVPTPA